LNKPAPASESPYSRLRRFPRHRMDVHIQVATFRDGATATLWGRTSELGQDGVGATLTGELTPGEVVSMEFPIPISPHIVKIRAIVRYRQGLHCGFEFLIMTDGQRQTLARVCEMLATTY
jgi:PilZ domain-containing protein